MPLDEPLSNPSGTHTKGAPSGDDRQFEFPNALLTLKMKNIQIFTAILLRIDDQRLICRVALQVFFYKRTDHNYPQVVVAGIIQGGFRQGSSNTPT